MIRTLPVTWQGQSVGHIDDPKIDNFHLYGRWVPDPSESASRFAAAVTEAEHEVSVVCGTGVPALRGTVESLGFMPGSFVVEIEITIRP